ncbi:hypothetical protein Ciccas_002133 [Cichlidogyrus casuarinus]|uniref:Uncharacterized protein n=1 Tax=Cichlidogyrus casuarinus TaxID=1844966 RepID=A0ABD2QI53_9PLAT
MVLCRPSGVDVTRLIHDYKQRQQLSFQEEPRPVSVDRRKPSFTPSFPMRRSLSSTVPSIVISSSAMSNTCPKPRFNILKPSSSTTTTSSLHRITTRQIPNVTEDEDQKRIPGRVIVRKVSLASTSPMFPTRMAGVSVVTTTTARRPPAIGGVLRHSFGSRIESTGGGLTGASSGGSNGSQYFVGGGGASSVGGSSSVFSWCNQPLNQSSLSTVNAPNVVISPNTGFGQQVRNH